MIAALCWLVHYCHWRNLKQAQCGTNINWTPNHRGGGVNQLPETSCKFLLQDLFSFCSLQRDSPPPVLYSFLFLHAFSFVHFSFQLFVLKNQQWYFSNFLIKLKAWIKRHISVLFLSLFQRISDIQHIHKVMISASPPTLCLCLSHYYSSSLLYLKFRTA